MTPCFIIFEMLPDMYVDANEELQSWIESELLLLEVVFGKYLDFMISKDVSWDMLSSWSMSPFLFVFVLSIVKNNEYLLMPGKFNLNVSWMSYSFTLPFCDTLSSMIFGACFVVGLHSSLDTLEPFKHERM